MQSSFTQLKRFKILGYWSNSQHTRLKWRLRCLVQIIAYTLQSSSRSLGAFTMSLIKITPDTLQSAPVKRNPVLNHWFRSERWFNRNTITSTTPLSNWCLLKALANHNNYTHVSQLLIKWRLFVDFSCIYQWFITSMFAVIAVIEWSFILW